MLAAVTPITVTCGEHGGQYEAPVLTVPILNEKATPPGSGPARRLQDQEARTSALDLRVCTGLWTLALTSSPSRSAGQ